MIDIFMYNWNCSEFATIKLAKIESQGSAGNFVSNSLLTSLSFYVSEL